MIRVHEFNTQWLGYKCGIITDLSFFSLEKKRQQQELECYQFVELRTAESLVKNIKNINECGFWYVDTQIRFTLDLKHLPNDPIAQQLQFERASDIDFQINAENICSYSNERFLAIPRVTQQMVDQRYLKIIDTLINNHPEYCLQINDQDQIQGWYFGTPNSNGIELTLAMLHKEAHIRGKQLYQKAISIYAQEFSMGSSRFSINNIPVHNILAKFGARFLDPETAWFWFRN